MYHDGYYFDQRLKVHIKLLLLYGVSPVRPAPAELPQDRKVARVGGCSGAIQVAYPFFYRIYYLCGCYGSTVYTVI